MLTSDLLRASLYRGKLRPLFLRTGDAEARHSAEPLLELFRKAGGLSLACLREEVAGLVEPLDQPVVWKGLARVLEARCTLVSPTLQLGWESRFKLFSKAAEIRLAGGLDEPARGSLVASEAAILGIDPETLLHMLYADVPGNELVSSFEDITWERLVGEYNLALAQGMLLRAEVLRVHLEAGTSRQLRALVQAAKFHQLHWRISPGEKTGGMDIQLDGPLSLFDSTTKYGIRLACFLPTALAVAGVRVSARVQWGKKQKKSVEWEYTASTAELPTRHQTHQGPTPEVAGFHKLWNEAGSGWQLELSRRVIPCGDSVYWVPDFELCKQASGERLFLEILATPGREKLERLVQALEAKADLPWLLVCKGNPGKLEFNHPGIAWFRTFPSPEKVACQVEARAFRPHPDSGFQNPSTE